MALCLSPTWDFGLLLPPDSDWSFCRPLSPGSLALPLQIMGLLSLHNYEGQFLILRKKYIYTYSSFSLENPTLQEEPSTEHISAFLFHLEEASAILSLILMSTRA